MTTFDFKTAPLVSSGLSTSTILFGAKTGQSETSPDPITVPAVSDYLSTLTQELTNKTLTSSVGKGTWTASGTWTLPALTLGGTVSGGGQQLNNIIIGTSTPLAGTFTALTAASSTITQGTITADAPQINGAATWNNAGVTFTGWKLNVTSTASAAASLLLDLQVGGVSQFSVSKAGVITSANGTLVSAMTDTWNNAGTVFSAIKMDVTNTSSAALSRLIDLQIGSVPIFQVHKEKAVACFNAYTSDTNFESGGGWWDTNVWKMGTRVGSSGTARDTYIVTPNRQIVFSDASGAVSIPNNIYAGAGFNGFLIINQGGITGENADGILSLKNNAQNDFDRLCFGGAGSSYPALKRSSTTLQVRLGDDSLYTGLEAGSLGAGGVVSTSTFINIAACTTARSSLRFIQGAAPASPVDGDMWREDNTNTGLKIRINGVTKTMTVA